ncbi:MFS general substrate transporter [Ramicandelaber brevisporus]|nr:MFS general substrate transporter [Ramicandelaber brevisporus]
MQHPFHQTTRSKRTNAFILIALCLSVFMSTFDTTVVATALPRLASDLHAMDTVSGVITAFLLAFSIGQPIFGKLSDIFGRKTMYLISLILFFIGSALCGASVTIVMLVAARAVQGLGASSLTNLAMIIIADIYSVREAGKYIGLICIVAAVGTVVGPLAGGALVDKLSWRWVFLIQLPFCLLPIILLAVFLRIPSTLDQTNTRPSLRRSLRRVDFVGSLAFAAAISCILLATQWGGHEYSWSSSQIVGLYICGGILVCVFLCVETKWTQEPVVPLSMFRLRNVWLSSVMNVFVGALFFGLIFFIPIYFQAAMGDSATKSGTRLISYMASLCVVAAISGAIVAETGRYRVQIWFGSALTTVGSCLLLLWWKSDANATSPAMQICFPMITGIGLGMLVQTTITSTQSQLPLTDLAAGTSMANLLRTMGGTIGVAIKSAIVSNSLRTNILNSPGAGSIENIDNLVKIAVDGVGAIETLPPDQKAIVLAAYVKALHGAFLVFVPCAVIVFVGGLFLKHAVLSTSTTATTPAASGDSVDEVKV